MQKTSICNIGNSEVEDNKIAASPSKKEKILSHTIDALQNVFVLKVWQNNKKKEKGEA
jgi:hypothetical protein